MKLGGGGGGAEGRSSQRRKKNVSLISLKVSTVLFTSSSYVSVSSLTEKAYSKGFQITLP